MTKAERRAYEAEWRKANPEKARAIQAAWRMRNPDYYKKRYRREREKHLARMLAHRQIGEVA